jgi:hypothetical protein
MEDIVKMHPNLNGASEKEKTLLVTLLHSYWTIKDSFRKNDEGAKALALENLRAALDEVDTPTNEALDLVNSAVSEIEKSEATKKTSEKDLHLTMLCGYPIYLI